MRRSLIALVAAGLLLPVIASAVDVLDVDASKYINQESFLGYVPDRFVVVLKDGSQIDHRRDARVNTALSNLTGFEELAQKYQVNRLQPQFPGSDLNAAASAAGKGDLARHYKVHISSGTLEQAMADYAALPDVERVEPIGIHLLYGTPNDGYYTDQWHYYDTYGVEADAAWDTEPGDQTVVVGDLDIGTMYDHGDLGGSNPPGPNDASTNGNIWVNTNETPGNGIDDDGNGYVDDIIGWDFVASTAWYSYTCTDIDCGGADNDPSDGNGHGTHTAGTIAAITNNGYAGSGVAGGWGDGTFAGGGNGVKVVPCRIGYQLYYFGQDVGVVIMDYVAEAMYYMADLKTSGWNVAAINCSFGTSNSGGLGAACDYLVAQDVLVVVAAGNSNSSSADYLGSRTDCLDVGATDVNGNPASFSNYGSWVDIAAPGVDILSTMTDPSNPGVDYIASMDGTSMACPHVVGVAALLESYDPSLSAQDKWNLMVNNAKSYNMTKDVGDGIVDAAACLAAIGPTCDVTAAFAANTTSGCAPLTVNFTDQSTGTGIDGWSWNFGDGGTSTAQNPSHAYTSAGTYTVTLTASSSSQSCNDVETKTGYITVSAGPTAGFVGSPTSGTEPLTVSFTNQSTNATSYSWNFGDGGTSTATNPNHTYNSDGVYTVTLTAYNACGSDVFTRNNYITVNPCVTPTAAFTGSPTSGDYPLQVNFTNQSSGASSYSWSFGDGGTSTAANPSHTYTAEGTYTVTLTATNACGSDQEVKTDYITVTTPPCDPPVADFDGSPTYGDAPLSVGFVDASTNNPTSWSWAFGDGGTSAAQNPNHTYTSPGTYTVSLTATNACGSDGETKVDYVTVTEPAGWTVITYDDFESGWGTYTDGGGDCALYTGGSYAHQGSNAADIQDNSGTASSFYHTTGYDVSGFDELEVAFWYMAVSMDNSNEDFWLQYYDGSSWVTVETWARSTDFDNNVFYNEVVTLSSSQYNFPTNARLRFVCDASGNSDDVYIDEIEFRGSGGTPTAPTAAFAGSPTSGMLPLEVAFTDQSTGGATSWSWTFGDGGTSTAQNPNHTYTSAGTYTVSLTVSNVYGSDDETKVNYITVTNPPPPTAAFVGSPTNGYAPLTVGFTDQSTGGPTSWSWTFGDGGTSTAQNPSHQYASAGTYTVSLTATNTYGSDVETKTNYITVSEPSANLMHVHNIVVTRSSFWRYSRGSATVTIYDQGGSPVPSATVYGSFSGPLSQNVSGSTNSSGQITFTSNWSTSSSQWCFTVTNVVKTDWTYDSDANEVTQACESGVVYATDATISASKVEVPESYGLAQNHPNPFNPSTLVSFSLPVASHATLYVYNVAGQKVATLADGNFSAGTHYTEWDATDFASGVYFYRLQAGEFSETKKMILLK